ncbi:MAG: COX15/CtaA family protein [Bdellovibrionaceae bacterium]|nr:COX15/CtaA family protein [Bdellovibrio sp.]
MTKPINLATKEARLLFFVWAYTLLVILWGAWVRISHSGDGCGDHWPLCGGALIPSFQQTKTWIEYTHRIMSGLYGLLVIFMFFRLRARIHLIPRQQSFLKKLILSFLILMITEALLGAILVKGQLVTVNDSLLRMMVMIFHQLNSFLLTGVTYLLYRIFKSPNEVYSTKNQKYLFLFLLLPITGAIASLSTTLFPSVSLWQGIIDDFSHASHLFIRLRALHPLFAVLIATGFIIWCYAKNHSRLALEFLIAITVGIITLLTLSPVYLKLAHLLIAHLLWARVLYTLVNLPDSNNR